MTKYIAVFMVVVGLPSFLCAQSDGRVNLTGLGASTVGAIDYLGPFGDVQGGAAACSCPAEAQLLVALNCCEDIISVAYTERVQFDPRSGSQRQVYLVRTLVGRERAMKAAQQLVAALAGARQSLTETPHVRNRALASLYESLRDFAMAFSIGDGQESQAIAVAPIEALGEVSTAGSIDGDELLCLADIGKVFVDEALGARATLEGQGRFVGNRAVCQVESFGAQVQQPLVTFTFAMLRLKVLLNLFASVATLPEELQGRRDELRDSFLSLRRWAEEKVFTDSASETDTSRLFTVFPTSSWVGGHYID